MARCRQKRMKLNFDANVSVVQQQQQRRNSIISSSVISAVGFWDEKGQKMYHKRIPFSLTTKANCIQSPIFHIQAVLTAVQLHQPEQTRRSININKVFMTLFVSSDLYLMFETNLCNPTHDQCIILLERLLNRLQTILQTKAGNLNSN